MEKSKIHVLVFPAEGSNAIELHDALSSCVNIKLYGASSVERHGKYIFKNYIGNAPNIFATDFISQFNRIIKENSIDVIFPTHDTVALKLAEYEKDITCRIIQGDLKTAQICRSKILTHTLFSDCSFIPKRIDIAQIHKEDFPLFAKPDEGQGAVGAQKISNIEELKGKDYNNFLVTEFLPGLEYTVDCFTDKDKNLRYIAPRTRERLMAGISVAGQTLQLTKEIQQIAETINDRLHFLGLWYFQLKKDRTGKLKLLEISTRCAGTMCLTRARGINLPLLSVYTALGYDISIMENSYHVKMDRALIGRYDIDYFYKTVYIDFDDTITLNNQVNLNSIRFLYQCKNQNKKIILLTKHAAEIEKTLESYAISKSLFNKIISIKENDSKSSHIIPQDAIFIDNAYKERYEVSTKLHIPVFDVDGIEFLLDWKI